MKQIIIKPIAFILFLFIFQATDAFAQPDAIRAKERFITMKKVRLLEILNLTEEKSNRFLSAYNISENKIFDLSRNLDQATDDLRELLAGQNVKASELKQRTDNILKLQEELNAAHSEKIKSVKSILNEEEFAKYILFERHFQAEVRKHLMGRPERRRGDRMGPPTDEPPIEPSERRPRR